MNPRQTAQTATTIVTTLLVAFVAYSVTSPQLHAAATAGVAAPLASPSPKRPPATAKPTPPPPAASPSPGRFSVVGFDMADSTHAWLLASDCPLHDSPSCRYEVARSQDGGRTWSRPVFVGPSVPTAGLGGNRSIRFLNSRDGFVYNQVAGFETHDGGITWRAIGVPFVFIGALEAGAGKVWMVTYPCVKGTVCAYQLRSSEDGGRTWTDPTPLAEGFSVDRIDAFAGGAMLANLGPPFAVRLTTDGGTTWRSASLPCPTNTFHAAAASPDGVELWAACYPLDQGGVMVPALTVWVSENGGRSWASIKLDSGANSLFVSPRPHVLFAAARTPEIRVTRDGGASWNQVLVADGLAEFVEMRFVDGDFGWATDATGATWTTIDGGMSWIAGPGLPGTIS